MNRSFVFVVSFLLLIVAAGRADAQWARFRGPNGSGVDLSVGYPVEFSPTKNVAWKASVPYGRSSPVVVSPRLYGTAGPQRWTGLRADARRLVLLQLAVAQPQRQDIELRRLLESWH
jgi:hypothetical protein